MTRNITERFTGWRGQEGVFVPIRREISVNGELKEALGVAVAWDAMEMLVEVPEGELRVPGGR